MAKFEKSILTGYMCRLILTDRALHTTEMNTFLLFSGPFISVCDTIAWILVWFSIWRCLFFQFLLFLWMYVSGCMLLSSRPCSSGNIQYLVMIQVVSIAFWVPHMEIKHLIVLAGRSHRLHLACHYWKHQMKCLLDFKCSEKSVILVIKDKCSGDYLVFLLRWVFPHIRNKNLGDKQWLLFWAICSYWLVK